MCFMPDMRPPGFASNVTADSTQLLPIRYSIISWWVCRCQWKGEYQSRNVAIKVLRIYSTSDFDKVTTVGSPVLLGVYIVQLMLAHIGVL